MRLRRMGDPGLRGRRGILLGLGGLACGLAGAPTDACAATPRLAVLRHHAALVHASYAEAIAQTRVLQREILAFLAAPNVTREDVYERLRVIVGSDMPARRDALPAPPSEIRNMLQLRVVALAVALFTGFVMAFVVLTIAGTAFRGHGMELNWPWQNPRHPEGANVLLGLFF